MSTRNTKYRDSIVKAMEKYYVPLTKEDFSHDINHVFRVERLAKRIAKAEKADMEIVEAASLIFDVARILEDKGKVEDHAEEGSKIARKILSKIGFPLEKIEPVCHAVLVHRKSKNRKPKTIEAKILQDADYLDAIGAIDVARVIASSLQSKKYKRPIYIEESYNGEEIRSAIQYLEHKLEHPKLKPDKFQTALGRHLAEERFAFMKEYVKRFKDEWVGKR
jgi:uncharacterized protein